MNTEQTKQETVKQKEEEEKIPESQISNKDQLLCKIPGFPDCDPNLAIVREKLIYETKQIYSDFGYNPLETRLVEPLEILEQKGIDGKEVYCLGKIHDKEIDLGGEQSQKLALRFDLTVPLARYIAMYWRNLTFPFKRYQCQKVYRGEHAKESKGRLREFDQLDLDVIGRGDLHLAYDAEFPAIIYRVFTEVFKVQEFYIRISNRKILESIFGIKFGVDDQKKIKKAINIIDNMEKVSEDDTYKKLNELGLTKYVVEPLLQFFKFCQEHDGLESLAQLKQLSRKFTVGDDKNEFVQNCLKTFTLGIEELEYVFRKMKQLKVPSRFTRFDPSIARGLDYYDGTVYETIIPKLKHLGSVCSGGRYSKLTQSISNDTNLNFPGSGISIGISRLFPELIKNNQYLNGSRSTMSDVVVLTKNQDLDDYTMDLAQQIRNAKIKTTTHPFAPDFSKQLKYASEGEFHLAVFVSDKQAEAEKKVTIKCLAERDQKDIPESQMIAFIQDYLQKKKQQEAKQNEQPQEIQNSKEYYATEEDIKSLLNGLNIQLKD